MRLAHGPMTMQFWIGDFDGWSMAVAAQVKTVGALTPNEYRCQQWQHQPELFSRNPFHHNLGLYI